MKTDSINQAIDGYFNNLDLNWIALITAIGSLMAAIAALITARETKKIREASIYPDLNILLTPIYFYSRKIKDKIFPFHIINESYDSIEDISEISIAGIKVCNFGLAVAKNIKYRFIDNLDEWIKKVNDLNSDGFFHIDKGNGVLSISLPKINDHYDSVIIDNEFRYNVIDYILPINQDKTDIRIPIPKSYLNLWIIYISLLTKFYISKDSEFDGIKNIDFLPINLLIEYEDLNGIVHERNYTIDIDFHSFIGSDSIKESKIYLGHHYLKPRIK